jgi:hypothetical protein
VKKQALLKARPRPGSFNTGGPRLPRILPPPPSVQRRNSAAADLITFGSPEGSPTSQNPPCPALDELYKSINCTTDELTAEISIPFPSQTQFPVSVSQLVEEINEHTTTRLPHLPLPFEQPSLMSVGVVKDAATRVYSPVFSGRPALQSPEHVANHTDAKPTLDVLKVVGKRDNNNLIDLTPFDSLGTEGMQTSVRGSVLEVFDPLLSGCQQESKLAEEVQQLAEEQNRGTNNQTNGLNYALTNKITNHSGTVFLVKLVASQMIKMSPSFFMELKNLLLFSQESAQANCIQSTLPHSAV